MSVHDTRVAAVAAAPARSVSASRRAAGPKPAVWIAASALVVAGVVPVGRASAGDHAAPALEDAVEYFVTRPTRISRDPSRGHLAFSDMSLSFGTSFSYFASEDPDVHDVINETSMTIAKTFDGFGAKWVAELDVTRAGDVDDQFETLDWAYEGSLNRNLSLAGHSLQASFFVRYDDGSTLGDRDDASWAPGVSLVMPIELCDGGIAPRAARTRGRLSDNLADKLLPQVSIEEVFYRGLTGSEGRDWDSQVGLGYEHPFGHDMSFGATGKWHYFHDAEDSVYTLRVALAKRFDQTLSVEMYALAERGAGSSDQHDEIVGIALNLDF